MSYCWPLKMPLKTEVKSRTLRKWSEIPINCSKNFGKPKTNTPPLLGHFAQIKNSLKGIQQYETFKSAPNNLARPLFPPSATLPKYGLP